MIQEISSSFISAVVQSVRKGFAPTMAAERSDIVIQKKKHQINWRFFPDQSIPII
jgi:hypothetical protein